MSEVFNYITMNGRGFAALGQVEGRIESAFVPMTETTRSCVEADVAEGISRDIANAVDLGRD